MHDVEPPIADHLAVGRLHSCFARNGELWCWGNNTHAELGFGTMIASATPRLLDLRDVVEVAPSALSTCARDLNERLYCWGDNEFGEVGDGTSASPRPLPVQVLDGVAAIAARGFGRHACARMVDGTARCWGYNPDGALGLEPKPIAYRDTPVHIPALDGANEITLGEWFTCARFGGGVRCVGMNSTGQLGDGTTESRSAYADVKTLVDATAISAGFAHACAITSARAVRCWGHNGTGQLGDGTQIQRSLPVDVLGLPGPVAEVRGGEEHTCARLVDGRVACWGANVAGQLGIADSAPLQLRPVVVDSIADAVEIAAGTRHTCARLGDGSVWCWGDNGFGQLGDGTKGRRRTPVRVTF